MREELRGVAIDIVLYNPQVALVSPYFKQKLQNLYANALQEAKHEQA